MKNSQNLEMLPSEETDERFAEAYGTACPGSCGHTGGDGGWLTNHNEIAVEG